MPAHSYTEYAEYKGTTVGFCTHCGFWHLLTPKTEEYYEADQFYGTFSPPDWFAKEKGEHDAGLWDASYNYQLGLLNKYHQKYHPRGYILDIGCGAGWFVRHVRRRGYPSAGVDPSDSALAFLGLNEIHKKIPDEQFGFIRASLVLEHLPNPQMELLNWHNHLHHDGLLMIIVPNDFSPLQEKLKTRHFISPVHANYFQPITLASLLSNTGFEVIHQSATFPMDLPLLLGYDYRGNDQKGRKVHRARLHFEKLLGTNAFRLYKKLFDWWGWGREIIMVARKT